MKTNELEDLMIKHMPKFAQIECSRMFSDEDGIDRRMTSQELGRINMESLVALATATPGMSQAQILTKTEIVRSSVQRHLANAIDAGLIRTVTIGRRKKYYPAVKTVNVNGEK